jgi:hypothetical protein
MQDGGKPRRLDAARPITKRQGIAPGGTWLAIGRLPGKASHRDMALSALRAATGENPAA